MTPPMASVPKPTGTTPLYTSIRSAKLTGILFRLKELPTPSCGTPSMNTLTCFPLKPSSINCMSEPTPPDSRSFMPGALVKASLRFFVVFWSSFVSTATALNADLFTRLTPVETIVTSSSCCVSGAMVMFSFIRSSLTSFTFFSTFV